MLKKGILNPTILSLLARVRHTNVLVVADRGFPSWSMIETVDVSVVDDLPTVSQLVTAIRQNHHFPMAFQAEEFLNSNDAAARKRFADVLAGIQVQYEPHIELKKRVPAAIGLIRTGDTMQYANIVLVSG